MVVDVQWNANGYRRLAQDLRVILRLPEGKQQLELNDLKTKVQRLTEQVIMLQN